MYSRLINAPKNKSFFLFGPRGTGKTTWVRTAFPDAVYIDLLEAEKYTDLLANPQRLLNFIPPSYKGWVIIDEVQRIPELLYEVHRLIESKKHQLKFVLTGSSARKLSKKGTNLLAGRALTYYMHPLTATELSKDFKLTRSLRYGQMPSVYTESDPEGYLKSYVKTYLETEVLQEGLTRNLAAFARFLETASFSQAAVLNISEVARECAVERKVVENYFTILEDLLIAVRLPVLTRRAKRRLAVHPKFYYFDAGIYRAIRPAGPLDHPEEIEGAACETLFLQEVRALNDALGLGYKIYYWRTARHIEVDIVLHGPRGLKVFEIKRTRRLSRSIFKGLSSFLVDYPKAHAFLIGGGKGYMREGSIEILSMADAMRRLPKIL